jgi:hypothetical protein
VQFISGKTDPIEKIKKMATAQEKALGVTLKQIDKFQKQATDYAVDNKNNQYDKVGSHFGGTGTDGKAPEGKRDFTKSASTYQKGAAGFQKQVSAMQEALGVANSAALTEIKFAVSQSRRIAASIVAYRGKKHEDTDLLLLDIEQEAAEYEVLSDLEAVG